MKIYAYLALVLPLAIMAISGTIAYLIPGCTVDEGAGSSTACGAIGPFLANGILGGFLWLIFGILGLFPALFIWALFIKKSSAVPPSSFLFRGFEDEITREKKDGAQ